MPKWYPHYEKQFNFFPLKLRSFTYGKPLELKEIQAVMNTDYLLHNFWCIEEDELKQKVLTFVIIKNVIKIQIFLRAILRMRNEAATRIKRKVKFIKEQREKALNKNQILD